MKKSTYTDIEILNNCGVNYTFQGALSALLVVTVRKYCNLLICTFIALIGINLTARVATKNRLQKKGDPGFEYPNDLAQTTRQGIVLYIVVALLSIPTGICAKQHQRIEYTPPLVARGLAPEQIRQELESIPFGMAAKELTRAIARADAEAALAALPPFHQPIMKAARQYQVDAALIRAIIMAESSNNPLAVSHRGAQGLMQLMPSTARWLGVEDAFNPELNIDAGVRYLKRLLNRFDGNVKLALAAYNAGSRYVRKYGGVPPFKATRIYIKKVLEYRQKYQNEMAANEPGLTAV